MIQRKLGAKKTPFTNRRVSRGQTSRKFGSSANRITWPLEGQITRIIERKRKEIVGQLKKSRSFYFVTPDDPKIHRDIYVDEKSLKDSVTGDKVAVGIISWEDRMQNPVGEIVEVIGKVGDTSTLK